MNADVARVFVFLRDNGILPESYVLQVLQSVGGDSATGISFVNALSQLASPWDGVTPLMEPHIQSGIMASVCGAGLPFPGPRVGRWLILRSLDYTGIEPRYLAVDFDARKEPTAHPFAELRSSTPRTSALLANEAAILSLLKTAKCPGVPNAHPLVETGDWTFLPTDVVAGASLAFAVAGDGQLSLPLALGVAQKLLTTCVATSRSGIVHRNLDPEHVLYTGDIHEEFTLTVRGWEFGKQLGVTERADVLRGGFPNRGDDQQVAIAYRAPELRNEDPVSETSLACDVYSFGAIVHFLLSGSVPPEDGASGIEVLPEILRPLAAKMLSGNPADRPTFVEVRERLAEIEGRVSEIQSQNVTVLDPLAGQVAEHTPAESPSGKAMKEGRGSKQSSVPVVSGEWGGGPRPLSRKRSSEAEKQSKDQRPSKKRTDAQDSRGVASTKQGAKSPKTTAGTQSSDHRIDTEEGRPSSSGVAKALKSWRDKVRDEPARDLESTRCNPLVVVEDPLNLRSVDAGLMKFSEDLLGIHWPNTSDKEIAFVRNFRNALDRLQDPSFMEQAERQAEMAKSKASVGNFAEAVPLLLSAWQCVPCNRAFFARLVAGRARLNPKGRSVLKKALGTAARFNPARIRPVYHALAVGQVIEALTSADKLLASSPEDGRSLWGIAAAADLLEAWPLCEFALDQLWMVPGGGGVDRVAVAAARTKLQTIIGDVDRIPSLLKDLTTACDEANVEPAFLEKFRRLVVADIQAKKFEATSH